MLGPVGGLPLFARSALRWGWDPPPARVRRAVAAARQDPADIGPGDDPTGSPGKGKRWWPGTRVRWRSPRGPSSRALQSRRTASSSSVNPPSPWRPRPGDVPREERSLSPCRHPGAGRRKHIVGECPRSVDAPALTERDVRPVGERQSRTQSRRALRRQVVDHHRRQVRATDLLSPLRTAPARSDPRPDGTPATRCESEPEVARAAKRSASASACRGGWTAGSRRAVADPALVILRGSLRHVTRPSPSHGPCGAHLWSRARFNRRCPWRLRTITDAPGSATATRTGLPDLAAGISHWIAAQRLVPSAEALEQAELFSRRHGGGAAHRPEWRCAGARSAHDASLLRIPAGGAVRQREPGRCPAPSGLRLTAARGSTTPSG